MGVYYIYFHKKADNGDVFYVGKGKDRRCFVKRCRSFHWNNIVNKHGYTIEVIEQGLSESEAIEREIFWINKLGRIDLKTGCLVNFTNGGEGSSGRPMSDRTKSIISQTNKVRPPSPNQKKFIANLFKGKTGKDHNRSKSVRCTETGIIYGSQSEAQRELKLGGGSVSWSIKHSKPIYGMHFEIAT